METENGSGGERLATLEGKMDNVVEMITKLIAMTKKGNFSGDANQIYEKKHHEAASKYSVTCLLSGPCLLRIPPTFRLYSVQQQRPLSIGGGKEWCRKGSSSKTWTRERRRMRATDLHLESGSQRRRSRVSRDRREASSRLQLEKYRQL